MSNRSIVVRVSSSLAMENVSLFAIALVTILVFLRKFGNSNTLIGSFYRMVFVFFRILVSF